MTPPGMFPIQGGEPVRLWAAERAYITYKKHFGSDQTLERLAERGGFGISEFACLFLGHLPMLHGRHDGLECVEQAYRQVLRARITELEATQAELVGALRHYGQHYGCDFHMTEICDCGLHTVLAKVAKGGET